MENERRIFSSELTIETRESGADAGKKLKGHAAVFNKLSSNLGGFREQIAPGAFDGVLDNDVRALFNHDSNHVLGRSSAGTLELGVDKTGLKYSVDLPDTQVGRDLAISVERGDIKESSFAFRVAPNGDDWEENEDGVIIRTITKFAALMDVSPVTYPAYPDATVAMRSLENFKHTLDECRAGRRDIYRMKTRLVELRSFDL